VLVRGHEWRSEHGGWRGKSLPGRAMAGRPQGSPKRHQPKEVETEQLVAVSVGAGVVLVEWGRLRRPRRVAQLPGPSPHGRRKRPLPPHPPPPLYTGSFFWRRSVTFVGAGAEGMRREDACVALGGWGKRAQQQDEGDASVPSPHNPTPAPTGTKGLPRRHEKKPPFVKPPRPYG
jgi:hypothetical protein